MTRFTLENWKRFRTHGKCTTIRVKGLSIGEHKVVGGQRYKSIPLGRILVGAATRDEVKRLTEMDAQNDGFDSLCELIIELAHLNPKLTAQTSVFIQPVTVVEDLLGTAGT